MFPLHHLHCHWLRIRHRLPRRLRADPAPVLLHRPDPHLPLLLHLTPSLTLRLHVPHHQPPACPRLSWTYLRHRPLRLLLQQNPLLNWTSRLHLLLSLMLPHSLIPALTLTPHPVRHHPHCCSDPHQCPVPFLLPLLPLTPTLS